MAQLDPIHKYSQTSKGTERSWSTSSSPTTYDQEEYTPISHSKKSVITKVKEKAKKLKHSLSGNKNKKLHENDVHDENNTPSWGVTLEDEDEEEDDEDPEFLGAPMYESELAPDALKEAARQHPRADPVLSEKNIVPSPTKTDVIEHEITQKLPESPNKTITETVTEKLAPAYAVVSDATHAIASKISSFSMSNNQESGHLGKNAEQDIIPKSGYLGKTEEQNAIPKSGYWEKTAEQNTIPKSGYLGQNVEQKAIPKSGHLEQNENLSSPHKWDKGVSVKEYFVEKFEPGEGERSLSQIITEAISPRQQASGDIGIMEKMKGAVSSFIRADDSQKSTENTTKSPTLNNSNNISSKYTKFSPKNSNLDSKNIIISPNDNLPQDNNPINMPHSKSYINESAVSLSHLPEFHSASSSPLIPISSSIHEVVEEEQSHGRILQPN